MISEQVRRAGFLARTLEAYGEAAVKTQRQRIAERTNQRSGVLINTPKATDLVGGNDSGALVFDVVNYQRFLDMRLSSRIYNNIFGWYYNAIAEQLQYGYMVQAKEELRKVND